MHFTRQTSNLLITKEISFFTHATPVALGGGGVEPSRGYRREQRALNRLAKEKKEEKCLFGFEKDTCSVSPMSVSVCH